MTWSLVVKIFMFWLHTASHHRVMRLIGHRSLIIAQCFCSDWPLFDSCNWQISIFAVSLTWNSTAWTTGIASPLESGSGCLQVCNTTFMMTEQYRYIFMCWYAKWYVANISSGPWFINLRTLYLLKIHLHSICHVILFYYFLLQVTQIWIYFHSNNLPYCAKMICLRERVIN